TDFQLGVLQRGFAELLFLDDYKLLERIGQGRMAGVYKAVHKHGQVVAVKVLPLSRGKDSKTLARFQREARMALRLKHPNCVRTYQVGETQSGLHYIVMEYLDGNTLEGVLKEHGKLPVGEALHVITQALRGLIHLDAAGLVHRDLKPANLMLVPPAGETVMQSQVKILDIGLGRAQFDEEAAGGLTREGTVLGTPLYMAPEQAQSASTVDIRADLYSLGCVLYHAVTGQPPFPDNNAMVQILRHASDKPQPLTTLAPDLPPALQEVMDKLLAKYRAERFATPAAALKALEALGQTAPSPVVQANVPMPSYLKSVEQQLPADEKPAPPLAEPVAKAGQYEYVATPLAKPLQTAAFVQQPEELTTAQLARRRSLAAAIGALIFLAIGAVIWGVLWFVENQ
ncbi:MAG TPA: serine/threonine-protein kinase, partial [Gemmataceae bacterium]|nr:serine/threonine-protein kinase [Gemmataceae bacterium]